MNLLDHWLLRKDIHFLNHGSFGATPRLVLQRQTELRDELERDPIRFLAPERELEPKLDRVRLRLQRLLKVDANHLVFVRNATEGVAAVLRSVPLAAGDEVVITNHGYNACSNIVRQRVLEAGAVLRTADIPFPLQNPGQVVEAVKRALGPRTKLLVIDHVTSPTGLLLPLKQVVDVAQLQGIRVLVDGAHAPGMLDVDLGDLNPDYYTANHHKWLCAPKASGFLYVRPEWQAEMLPPVISHAYSRPRSGRSRFLAQFDWTGTFDPTPLLCVPSALEFLKSLDPRGLVGVMERNRQLALKAQSLLADALELPRPAPTEMLGSLVAIPLPRAVLRDLSEAEFQHKLRSEFRFELPIYAGIQEGNSILRISLQVYNHLDQVIELASVLQTRLRARW